MNVEKYLKLKKKKKKQIPINTLLTYLKSINCSLEDFKKFKPNYEIKYDRYLKIDENLLSSIDLSIEKERKYWIESTTFTKF